MLLLFVEIVTMKNHIRYGVYTLYEEKSAKKNKKKQK